MNTKKHLLLLLLLIAIVHVGKTQAYDDYIGAGHARDITITTSSDWQEPGWTATASGDKTVNGAGLEGPLSEAARFLSHAAISYDMEEIEHVANIGMEAWIDEQIAQDYSLYLPMIEGVVEDYNAYQISIGGNPEGPGGKQQRTTWWRMNMLERDFLRDKITAAWSEILVISFDSDIGAYGYGLMDYLDFLKTHAFGNFEDILKGIATHPSMGVYLNHYQNKKANLAVNQFPDENFAREVMQLFTIGVYELNNDGTYRMDSEGNLIETYTVQDIAEMAKVFTGLGPGGVANSDNPPTFSLGFYGIDYTVPMMMYEEHHETTAKSIFDGDLVMPANQDGMTDINMALEYLFNHPNTGPFICQRLIQLLVKSNPTPAYIDRVASVFNADDNGVRGNMEAVFKAILLDEEARTCEWQQHPSQGRLKNPFEKSMQFTRVADVTSESNEVWTEAQVHGWLLSHIPLTAPSVFGFHERDYVPNGAIAEAGMVAPEFQIFNTHTAVGYSNIIHRWLYTPHGYGYGTWRDESHIMLPHLDAYLEAAQDPEVLLNMLDMRLTNGNLTSHTRSAIKTFITEIDENFFPSPEVYAIEKVKQVILMILMSPDYNINK